MKIIEYIPSFLKEYIKLIVNKKRFPNSEIHSPFIYKNVYLGRGTKVGPNVKLYDNVTVGDYTYINDNTYIGKNVQIGKYCSIAYNCQIGMHEHPSNFLTTSPKLYGENNILGLMPYWSDFNKKVIIGNDVWIGSNVIILQGVKVGDGAIIGAGAVVTKDVEEFAIVVGVPAKKIKSRFTNEQIMYLKELKWWDKGIEDLTEYKKLFLEKDRWYDLVKKSQYSFLNEEKMK